MINSFGRANTNNSSLLDKNGVANKLQIAWKQK